MVAFAGYPLVVKDRLIGVIALFARRSLTHATLEAMASVADEIALGIEQKRAEEALRDSEAKLQATVNTSFGAIITIDVEGNVLSFNPSAERVFGYAAAEVLGRNVSMLMPLPHSQEHGNYMARYVRTGERQRYRHRSRDYCPKKGRHDFSGGDRCERDPCWGQGDLRRHPPRHHREESGREGDPEPQCEPGADGGAADGRARVDAGQCHHRVGLFRS